MGSNSFGNIFKITTFGESHGNTIGVIIDGCPAGLKITIDEINNALEKRSPGTNIYTSPRKETDRGEILSGVFDDTTTGAPIAIVIKNHDSDSSKYEPIKNLMRPGHANYTYLQKYGIFDYRGGGRASARETAARVAAGAVAKKILDIHKIKVFAHLKSVGSEVNNDPYILNYSDEDISPKKLFCTNKKFENLVKIDLENLISNGDSIGGVVEFIAQDLPPGLGDPVYEKLEANLAKGMLSLPASKGFEIGPGFLSSTMKGSEYNDLFKSIENGKIFNTNNSGGTLGGISNSMPLIGRVAFKPTSSIKFSQETVDLEGESQVFKLPDGSRHDPCVAIRAVPVVKAMCQLVLADAILMNSFVKV